MEISKYQNFINNFIIKCDLINNIPNNKIKEACLYSLQNGKRLRSIIVLSLINSLCNFKNFNGIYAALCIELIHNASLILDDIMDKDTIRRGIPTLHILYGETTAQLVSIYLTTLSLKSIGTVINELKEKQIYDINKCNEIGMILFECISDCTNKLTMGQYLDLFPVSNFDDIKDYTNKLSKDDIKDIIYKKTSTLFEISFIFGFVLSNNTISIDKIKKIANSFGILFQIADDFEDIEQDSKKNENTITILNYPIKFGKEEAYQEFCYQTNLFINLMKEEGVYNSTFKEIIRLLVDKVKKFLN